jgi:hypothetical protein
MPITPAHAVYGRAVLVAARRAPYTCRAPHAHGPYTGRFLGPMSCAWAVGALVAARGVLHGEVFWGPCRAEGPAGGGWGARRAPPIRVVRPPGMGGAALVAARGARSPHLAGSGIQNTSPCEARGVPPV